MPATKAPLLFAILTIFAQVAGLALALLAGSLYPSTLNVQFVITCTLVIHSITALTITRFLRLPRSWQVLNGAIPLALYFGSTTSLSQTVIGAILGWLLITYLPAFWTRVPYYPTSIPMYEVVLSQLPNEGRFCFIDIGSGFGGLLNYLAKHRSNGQFTGVEIGPLPYLVCKLRFLLRTNIKIGFLSFWKVNFAEFDYVYAFLSPAPMPEVWDKVTKEMRKGTVFMTNSFAVPAKADNEIEVEDRRRCRLYLHKI